MLLQERLRHLQPQRRGGVRLAHAADEAGASEDGDEPLRHNKLVVVALPEDGVGLLQLFGPAEVLHEVVGDHAEPQARAECQDFRGHPARLEAQLRMALGDLAVVSLDERDQQPGEAHAGLEPDLADLAKVYEADPLGALVDQDVSWVRVRVEEAVDDDLVPVDAPDGAAQLHGVERGQGLPVLERRGAQAANREVVDRDAHVHGRP
mmetsp:Transcript_58589/g.156846  ORF Transcript_58589/g.156846 Transcript_58589/m.156846 type:complete len:207 (-) Transcript_58589:98-718(-)